MIEDFPAGTATVRAKLGIIHIMETTVALS